MSRIFYACIVSLFLVQTGIGQNMLSWVKTYTSSSNGSANPANICLDKQENVVIAGTLYGVMDFDLGPAEFTLTSVTGNGGQQIFVAKIDPQGGFLWAKKFDGSIYQDVRMTVSKKTGAIYLTGYFSQVIDCDPSPLTYYLYAVGSRDVFLIKLDANGNFVFGKSFGASDMDVGNAIAVDDSDNIFISGIFKETIDFDPGPGTALESSHLNGHNQFVCKFDSSGQFLWMKNLGNSVSYDIDVDKNSDLVLTGSFEGIVDFDPGPGTYTAATLHSFIYFGYVMKLSSGGNFKWAKAFRGSSQGLSIKVASDNSIFACGSFSGTVNFDTLSSNLIEYVPRKSAFIGRWDDNGNLVYVKNSSGKGYCEGMGVSVGPHDHLNFTGYFTKQLNYFVSDSVNFDQGSGTNIIVAEMHPSGAVEYNGVVGGLSIDFPHDIVTNAHGEYYIIGTFSDDGDFEPGPDSTFVHTNGSFLMKVRPKDITIGIGKNLPGIFSFSQVFPNPSSDIFKVTVRSTSAGDFVLTDSKGAQLLRTQFDSDKNEQYLNLKAFPSGIYFLQIRTKDGVEIKKLIKQ